MVYRTSPLHWCPEPCFAPAFQVSATAFQGYAPAIRCCAFAVASLGFAEALPFCPMPALSTTFPRHSRAGPFDAFAVLCCAVRAGPILCLPFRCRRDARQSYAVALHYGASAKQRSPTPMLRPSVRYLCADSRHCRGLLCGADALLTNAVAMLRVSATPSFAAPLPCRT